MAQKYYYLRGRHAALSWREGLIVVSFSSRPHQEEIHAFAEGCKEE
jgi:hypothetical protein